MQISFLLLHLLIGGNGIQGQATDIKIVAENLLKTKERLNRILAENTGKSIEEIYREK